MQSGNNLDPTFFYGWKDSRKVSGKAQSQFHLEDKNGTPVLSFEIEHLENKGYPIGGFCKWVKKGFPISHDAKFAVKKSTSKLSKRLALEYAMRAALFGRVMGDVTLPFVYEDGVYLMMNFFEGRSLSGLYKNNRSYLAAMSVEGRLKYAADILAQLTSLHDLDCIHRDIKPENVMLSDQSAKLIDLDGAFMEGEASLLQSFTFPFLNRANQQMLISRGIRHLRSEDIFSKKSDLYALGLTLCVLYFNLFRLDNLWPMAKAEDGTSIITVTKTIKDGSKHHQLADFFLLLLKDDCPYLSAREALVDFVKLCKTVYEQDFSTALTPNRSMTKHELKTALYKVDAVCDNVSREQEAYKATSAYQRRRFRQPKALISEKVLFSDDMKKLLAEFDPSDYPQVFKNIRGPLQWDRPIDKHIELYRGTLALLPDERKFIFLCACLKQLLSMNARVFDEIVTFWRDALDSFDKLEPSVAVISDMIGIANPRYRNVVAEILNRYYHIVTSCEENIHAIFTSFSRSDKLSVYDLYRLSFPLSSDVKVMLLKQLESSQRTDIFQAEWREARSSEEIASVICWYLNAGILDLSVLSKDEIGYRLINLQQEHLSLVCGELRNKYPVQDSLNIDIFHLFLSLSKLRPAAAMTLFYAYFCPHAARLAEVITSGQVEALMKLLVPRTKQDFFAIIVFFSRLNEFESICHIMQDIQWSVEEKVTLAMAIDPLLIDAFYDCYIDSNDLDTNNLMRLLRQLPAHGQYKFLHQHTARIKSLTNTLTEAEIREFHEICLTLADRVTTYDLAKFLSLLHHENRFAFILEHLDLVSVDMELRLIVDYIDDADYIFLSARQQIMRRLNHYAGDKLKIHDGRVAFIAEKVSHATSLPELASIITGNGFDAAAGHKHQFENRAPKHQLFSYGFSGLMKSCITILKELPSPLEKDVDSGFYILRK